MRSKLNAVMAVLGSVIKTVSFSAVKTAKGYSYSAVVGGVNQTSGQITSATICDSKGKVRLFIAIDDFFAEAAKLSVLDAAVDAGLANAALLAPKPFTGDIVKKNQNAVVSYGKQLTDQTAIVVDLETQVQLLQGEVTTAPSFLIEKQTQLAGATAWQAWLGAEIARINAALGVVY